MQRVLIVAYHFPPQSGSSGFLRALKFSRYLIEYGWRSVVLTVHERAYEKLDSQQLSNISPEVSVIRAFALDTKRHLSIRGRHLRALALPDRWASWCLGALPAGLRAIRANRINVILTTFPIATAVLIGFLLHRATGKPWVIDFRDSMTEEEYPRDERTRRIYRWIEKQAIRYGARWIFTAESARRMYLNRYPSLSPEKCLVIHNGYDEEDFKDLVPIQRNRGAGGPLRLLHSGLIYQEERDPKPFFRTLAKLKNEHQISAEKLRIDLRASGSEAEYSRCLRELGVDDIVHLLPALPYREALQDSACADGLLLMQAASCNHQIPAKAYEYMRIRKPILALTPQEGDTGRLLHKVGGTTIVNLADEAAMYHALPQFLHSVSAGNHPFPDPQEVERYTRRNQAGDLAACLQQVAAERA